MQDMDPHSCVPYNVSLDTSSAYEDMTESSHEDTSLSFTLDTSGSLSEGVTHIQQGHMLASNAWKRGLAHATGISNKDTTTTAAAVVQQSSNRTRRSNSQGYGILQW